MVQINIKKNIMAALQIKKHKVFLGSQDTQYVLNISYQKKKREREIKLVLNTHQIFSIAERQVLISWVYEEDPR